jgi:UDP-N-acetylglucosamine 2-epimerase (non-hydrolysing)
MRKIKVVSVVGTRPEAIKMAPVIKRLGETESIESLVVVTAQHREMLDQVLDLFEIKPDVDLDLMRPDQTLAGITAAIFTDLDPIFKDLSPDWVLAQGDTTTVMATALLSYYNQIRFGHVEAGLRTGDKFQPYPEEVNRKVAGAVADIHFAPTEWSRDNLLKENVHAHSILVTGNPVIDALEQVVQKPIPAQVEELLKEIGDKRTILVTAHRRENFGEPLQNICNAIEKLARDRHDVHIVYPVHRNPNVLDVVENRLGNVKGVTLLEPIEYLSMVHLMKHATLVLTDSGGIQEEAPYFGIPVLVLRQTTERPEGIQAGTVRLVGTFEDDILKEVNTLLDDSAEYAGMANAANPYGDGKAAERIVRALLDHS